MSAIVQEHFWSPIKFILLDSLNHGQKLNYTVDGGEVVRVAGLKWLRGWLEKQTGTADFKTSRALKMSK